MKVTTDILDISAYDKLKIAPATLVRREGKVWVTTESPIQAEEPPEWGWCKEGDMVRIPLFPYITKGTDPSVAIGFAFEFGFRARSYVDPHYDIEQLHLAIGHPVSECTYNDIPVLRVWLGIGFILRKKDE